MYQGSAVRGVVPIVLEMVWGGAWVFTQDSAVCGVGGLPGVDIRVSRSQVPR